RGLHDDVDAEVAPGEVRRVPLGEDAEPVALNDEVVVLGPDVAGEAAVDGVILEQVRQRGRVREVVDGDDVEVAGAALQDGAEDEAADAPEPVDPDLDSHAG